MKGGLFLCWGHKKAPPGGNLFRMGEGIILDMFPTVYTYSQKRQQIFLESVAFFSVFMAGLWLYSIPFAVPQSGRLIWWRIALGWSGALPADSRTRQWGSLWLR